MEHPFPIVRHPADDKRTPIQVSAPHFGTQPLPDITRDDYSEPWFETFAYGFADTLGIERQIAALVRHQNQMPGLNVPEGVTIGKRVKKGACQSGAGYDFEYGVTFRRLVARR